MFFKTYWLLWQNARNLNYIKEYNTKFARKLADSKLKTKDFLKAKWVDVPETLFVISKHEEVNDSIFEKLTPPFVVKPNGGFWGKWILIFNEIDATGNFITNNNEVYTKKQLLEHFGDILDWFYSLSGNRDKLIIEKKIELDEEIELLWKYGLPDLRVITFNMVPVMAMLRVPTEESGWKANLHAWACWVWIDIWTWKLTYISHHSKIVKSIPGIWDVRWIKIPNWDKVLNLTVKVQQVTKIWYLGCDIVLDKRDWPLLLEMNIRPWLEVQVANLAPLKDRLERVEWLFVNSVEKWVRLWRDLFSWDIEEKIKSISWKKVIWSKEYLNIIFNEKEHRYLTDIKPSNAKSYMDKNFAINVLGVSEKDIENWYIRVDANLLWEKKKVKFIFKDLWSVNLILWVTALKWFLLDPYKYKKWELPVWDIWNVVKWKNTAIRKNQEEQLKKLDKALIWIDKKLLILKYFWPTNLQEEKKKFIESKWEYIPQLKYNDMKLDLEKMQKDLEQIEVSDIPLSDIFKRKKEEIFNKINLLKAFRDWESKNITFYSSKVYGDVDEFNLEYCKNIISNKLEINNEEEFLTISEIKDFVKKFNHIYDINITLRESNKSARFVMKWDVLYVRHWAKVWKKEMRSIIAHEIEWHYLRKINWKKLDYTIFGHWTAWYLEIDEWIAIYNQNRFLSKSDRKYYGIFERYYFVSYALNHSYSKLLKKMLEYYENDYERVFNYLVRLKRGMKSFDSNWVFVKDLVYVNWYLKVDSFINNWGDLKELYIWKINLTDLEDIKTSYFLNTDLNDLKVPFFL